MLMPVIFAAARRNSAPRRRVGSEENFPGEVPVLNTYLRLVVLAAVVIAVLFVVVHIVLPLIVLAAVVAAVALAILFLINLFRRRSALPPG
jgi:Flp pilus assembly protein TadB